MKSERLRLCHIILPTLILDTFLPDMKVSHYNNKHMHMFHDVYNNETSPGMSESKSRLSVSNGN